MWPRGLSQGLEHLGSPRGKRHLAPHDGTSEAGVMHRASDRSLGNCPDTLAIVGIDRQRSAPRRKAKNAILVKGRRE